MAVKASKAGLSSAQVPEMLWNMDMENPVRNKLIDDIRREVNNFKVDKPDRFLLINDIGASAA